MNILCVAEKPSISKSVAQILSGGQFQTTPTANQYIKNYVFNANYQQRQSSITMTALMGHLMEFEFKDCKQWSVGSIPLLFEAEVEKRVRADMKQLETNIQKLARHSQMLVIWTDCDREGENIGAEVAKVALSVNPRITIKRARFAVVQQREIMNAWNSLIELDWKASEAVDARSELDLRIGAIFTRFQTLNLKPRFYDLSEQKVLSYGPCQFPTLGFVVDRYRKAKDFVEEPFWKIEVTVKTDVDTRFHWDRGHLFDEECTRSIHTMCLQENRAKIVSVQGRSTTKWPPLPLNTVELQKIGSTWLRLTSDRIMTIAESLYNQGIISYPRTETDSFPDNFGLKPLIEKQRGHPDWGNYAQGLLNGNFKKPRKGKHNDEAHPPIYPVRFDLNLHGDDKKVFDFIARRFLACCSEAAKGQETTVKLVIADEGFHASGLMVLERNYLEVYPFDKWTNSVVGEFEQGQIIVPTSVAIVPGSTAKPPMLTEADLIALMDSAGIGTDATIHEHIKKILEREYVTKEGQYFYPTTLGMALVTGYENIEIDISLAKPDLRALMENNMNLISQGQRTKEAVIQEVLLMYQTAFQSASNGVDTIIGCFKDFMTPVPDNEVPAEQNGGEFVRHCKRCKLSMYLKLSRNGKKYIGCSGYPVCKESIWFPAAVTSAKVIDRDCLRCSAGELKVKFVRLEFTNGSFPLGYTSPLEVCLWCDDGLQEFFGSNPGGGAPPSSSASRVPSRSTSNNNRTEFDPGPTFPTINTNRDSGMSMRTNQEPARAQFGSNSNYNNVSSENSVPCQCSVNAVVRTVRKEGANNGRQFYACSKPQSDTSRCDFFQWCDAETNDNHNIGRYQSQISQSSNTGANPKCQCGLISNCLTCSKPGPNQGRKFYNCMKSVGKCGFFEWADGVENAPPGNARNGVCFKCGEPGHFSNACPNGGNASTSTRGKRGRGSSRGRGSGRGRRGVGESRIRTVK